MISYGGVDFSSWNSEYGAKCRGVSRVDEIKNIPGVEELLFIIEAKEDPDHLPFNGLGMVKFGWQTITSPRHGYLRIGGGGGEGVGGFSVYMYRRRGLFSADLKNWFRFAPCI